MKKIINYEYKSTLFRFLILLFTFSSMYCSIKNRPQERAFKVKTLNGTITEYLNLSNLEKIYTVLYKKNPNLFTENSEKYFPLCEKDDDIVINFINTCIPLVDFFSQMKWGETGFPFSISELEPFIQGLFVLPYLSDSEVMKFADIVCIKGATFPTMLSRLLRTKKFLHSNIKGIYFLPKKSRLNTGLFYESVSHIVSTVETELGRKLHPSEIEFIEMNNENEYQLAKVIQYFFDTEKNTHIYFTNDHSDYEKFVLYVKSYYSNIKDIVIMSNNIFAYYDQYVWRRAIKNSNININCVAAGYDALLTDSKNPEGVLVKTIRMATLFLKMIRDNY